MIQTATDGTITHIHYNASGQRIAESDADGNVLREYIYLGQQAIALAITNGDNKTTYFIHNDHLGTPKLLTNISGTVVWQQHTTPFGEIQETLATGINNLKSFPGQYRDSETGYSYNYYRDYDPSLGRYVQSDPIGLNGGLNTYGYALQSPIMLTDPTGRCAWDACVGEGVVVTAFVNMVIATAVGIASFYWGEDDDEYDDYIPDDRYGGYTSYDEEDAENLANSLTGSESCELLREAITTLDNRIRGRKENLTDYAANDEGHIQRIEILEKARARLQEALDAGQCDGDC